MSETKLHPIFDPKKFVLENGEIMTPLYFDGSPRDYRLDLGFGTLCEGGKRDKVKGIGNTFKVIPIAVRALKGKVFVKNADLAKAEEKKWVEVYFVNEMGNLSMFMFHGYSVQNLAQATKTLKYEGGKLTESVLTVRCSEKENKQGQKYYMAFFAIEPLSEDDKIIVQSVYKNLAEKTPNIYRQDTMKYKTLFYENWNDGSIVTPELLKAEQEKEKGLLKEFATKEEELELEKKDKPKSTHKKLVDQGIDLITRATLAKQKKKAAKAAKAA